MVNDVGQSCSGGVLSDGAEEFGEETGGEEVMLRSAATLPRRRPPPHKISLVNQLHPERRGFASSAIALAQSAEFPTDDSIASRITSSPKLSNRESELNSSKHAHNLLTYDPGKPVPSPKFKPPYNMSEMFTEPVEESLPSDQSIWEYHNVSLSRVPGYGFGIAVSGGRDNPHFKSGDPSIVISDVLRGGPAWNILIVNDRITSANGVDLENVDYNTAVRIMKESEHLNLIVKRRVPMPVLEFEQRTLKLTLSKAKTKEDFGLVLGCKFFIKDVTNPKLCEKEGCPKEGDVVMKINGQSCDSMSLSDAQKLLDRSKEKLMLVIQRDVKRGHPWKWSSQSTLYERLGPDTPRSPRNSPMLSSIYSNDGESAHLNNVTRNGGKFGRLAVSEYGPSPAQNPQSRGSYASSRSRTPSHNYEESSQLSVSQRITTDSTASTATPPLNSEEDSMTASRITLTSVSDQQRFVSFRKEGGSVGIRVIGGNEVGIFVSAVQTGSPAAAQTVRPGDRILKVNNKDMKGVTREEAVLLLLGIQDSVDLMLQYKKEEFDRIRTQNLGDNFYIKTHFDYVKPENGEMTFCKSEIFQVIDTLHSGTVGSWQAVKVSAVGVSNDSGDYVNLVKGVIPNAARAEQMAYAQNCRMSLASQPKGGTFLRRKKNPSGEASRRSKSLTKGHWDEVVFGSAGIPNLPAYERVQLKHPGFFRPVVLFGALADIARDQLLRDFSLRFVAPPSEGENGENKTNGSLKVPNEKEMNGGSGSGIVRLSAIKQVISTNKHCVLDVTPSSVERLNFAQYYPIVIMLHVEARSRVRDLRKKYSKAAGSKNSRKLMEQSAELQKSFGHLFSAVLDASHEDRWFEALRELIGHLQERRVWMSETRPTETVEDDFLFPMSPASNRRSSSGNVDSDTDSLRGDQSDMMESMIGLPQSAIGLSNGQSELRSAVAREPIYTNGYQSEQEKSAFEFVKPRVDPDPSKVMPRRPPPLILTSQGESQSLSIDSGVSPSVASVPPPMTEMTQTGYPRQSSAAYSSRFCNETIVENLPHNPRPISLNIQPGTNGDSAVDMSDSLYENRESIMDHVATLRLAQQRHGQRLKPKPPPRMGSHPPVPPKPKLMQISSASVSTNSPVPADPNINRSIVQTSTSPAPGSAPIRPYSQFSISSHSSVASSNGGGGGGNVTAPSPVPHRSNYSSVIINPTALISRENAINPNYQMDSNILGRPPAQLAQDLTRGRPMSPRHESTERFSEPKSAPPTGTRNYYRHISEPGVYDVKQFLANQSDDFPRYIGTGNPTYVPGGPFPPTYPTTSQPHSNSPGPYSQPYRNGLNGQTPQMEDDIAAMRHQQNAQVARTSSMPASTLPYRVRQGIPGMASPAPTYGQDPRLCESPNSYGHTAPHVPSKSPVPPPAPKNHVETLNSPRSPNPRGQRLSYELVPVNFPDNLLDGSVDSSHSGSDHHDRMAYGQFQSTRSDLDRFGPMSRSYNEAELQRTLMNMSASRDYNSNDRKLENHKSQTPPAVSEKPTRPPRLMEAQRSATPKNEAVGSSFTFNTSGQDGTGGHMLKSSDLPLKPIALGNQYTTENSRSGQLCSESPLTERHSVLAEVRATIGSEGGSLMSPETGVSMVIPPGAIEKGSSKEIFFKVCQDNTMCPPLDAEKGETLLSPLVMCGPAGLKFLKPIEMRLPHNASSLSREQWTFALKSSCPDAAGNAEWKNATLTEIQNGNSGVVNDKFVSVCISHF